MSLPLPPSAIQPSCVAAFLFDQLVRAQQDRCRHIEAKRLGDLRIEQGLVFRSNLCAQLGGDFLSQSLKSKGLCRRIHFRRMPSVNDGPSELPDSGLAATSLSAGSPTSRITAASRSAPSAP